MAGKLAACFKAVSDAGSSELAKLLCASLAPLREQRHQLHCLQLLHSISAVTAISLITTKVTIWLLCFAQGMDTQAHCAAMCIHSTCSQCWSWYPFWVNGGKLCMQTNAHVLLNSQYTQLEPQQHVLIMCCCLNPELTKCGQLSLLQAKEVNASCLVYQKARLTCLLKTLFSCLVPKLLHGPPADTVCLTVFQAP